MQHSKLFIISLFLALSALVAASTTSEDAIVLKRAALDARMHRRAAAGHGSLKKRQPSAAEIEAKARVRRAQYHPTRTAAAAPGMEKRQLFGGGGLLGGNTNGGTGNIINIGSGGTGVNVGTGSGLLPCVNAFGIPIIGGCNPSAPQPSTRICGGRNYDGCAPGSNYGSNAAIGGTGASAGISECCQSGYTCTVVGPFQSQICLNFSVAQLYSLNQEIDRRAPSTQTELGNIFDIFRNQGTF